MCNAHNHSWDCTCGFGGDTGGGGRRGGGYQSAFIAEYVAYGAPSGGWCRDRDGTVTSYVNPNAHCPVCGATVFFYRSPYDGRVFFDQLGWPWPKHPCTDTSGYIRRTTRDSAGQSAPPTEPAWRAEGWHPLLSSRVHSAKDRLEVTGDGPDGFLELYFQRAASIDRESPIFIRPLADKPGLFEASFLRSNGAATYDSKAIAFPKQLLPVGESTVHKAITNDRDALYEMALYFLDKLAEPDIASARPYLEGAAALGHVEALIELSLLVICRVKS
jgi:hypothetical protein